MAAMVDRQLATLRALVPRRAGAAVALTLDDEVDLLVRRRMHLAEDLQPLLDLQCPVTAAATLRSFAAAGLADVEGRFARWFDPDARDRMVARIDDALAVDWITRLRELEYLEAEIHDLLVENVSTILARRPGQDGHADLPVR